MTRDISNFTCVSTATLQNIFPNVGYERAPQFTPDAKPEPAKAAVMRRSVKTEQRKRSSGRARSGR
jgi:hypothetical protein